MGHRCTVFSRAHCCCSAEGRTARAQSESQLPSAHSLAFSSSSFLYRNLNSSPRNYTQIYKARAMSCPASCGRHSASRTARKPSKSSWTGGQLASAARCMCGTGLLSLARKERSASGCSGCWKRAGAARKLGAFSGGKIGRPYSLKFQSDFLKVAVCSARKFFSKLGSHFWSQLGRQACSSAHSSCAFSYSLVSPAPSSPLFSCELAGRLRPCSDAYSFRLLNGSLTARFHFISLPTNPLIL